VIRATESKGFLTVLKAKHTLGRRIGRDASRLGVGRPKKGAHGVSLDQLAKDIGYSVGEVKNCIRFAQKYPEFNLFVTEKKLSPAGDFFLGWHTVRQAIWGEHEKALIEHRERAPNLTGCAHNMQQKSPYFRS